MKHFGLNRLIQRPAALQIAWVSWTGAVYPQLALWLVVGFKQCALELSVQITSQVGEVPKNFLGKFGMDSNN